MKQKDLLKAFLGLMVILSIGMTFTACEEDIPAPTVEIFITIDGFTVNIAAESLKADSWAWDYGDGTSSDSVASHIHTYASGGEYTISCTVTGEGGATTETETVTIATIEDLLSGGADVANGKTWVLSRTKSSPDGVGFVTVDLAPNYFPAVNNMLDVLDLPMEYDNEYTFKSDGSYELDNINGKVMASWVYSSMNVDPDDIITRTDYGIFQINNPNPTAATWTLHENENLTIETVFDQNDDQKEGVEETITFENVDYISFDGEGFIGMKDFTAIAIIREISPDRLTLTIFFHSYMGSPANDGNLYLKPSFIMTLTYDAI